MSQNNAVAMVTGLSPLNRKISGTTTVKVSKTMYGIVPNKPDCLWIGESFFWKRLSDQERIRQISDLQRLAPFFQWKSTIISNVQMSHLFGSIPFFFGNVFKVTSKQANLSWETTSEVFYMQMFNLSSIFKRFSNSILSKFDGDMNFSKYLLPNSGMVTEW